MHDDNMGFVHVEIYREGALLVFGAKFVGPNFQSLAFLLMLVTNKHALGFKKPRQQIKTLKLGQTPVPHTPCKNKTTYSAKNVIQYGQIYRRQRRTQNKNIC